MTLADRVAAGVVKAIFGAIGLALFVWAVAFDPLNRDDGDDYDV